MSAIYSILFSKFFLSIKLKMYGLSKWKNLEKDASKRMGVATKKAGQKTQMCPWTLWPISLNV